MVTKIIIISIVFLFAAWDIQAYSQQKINDFYLSNFKDGTQSWEVKGREAMVYDKYVDIENMIANYYLENDKVVITSDKARLHQDSMNVALQDNVHIKNKDGMELFTNSLNWERDKNLINTEDWVKTSKDSMQIIAQGLSADTQIKKADFEKNVEVTFPDEKTKTVTTATCSGPLEIEYSSGKAVFNDNVIVTHPQGKMFSDKTTLFFDVKEKKVVKIVSEGNVKIERENNVTFADKATYYDKEQKLILEGRPRLIYYPQAKGDDGLSGLFKKDKDKNKEKE
jgi:LPS export ABC transporter protein LptC